MTPLDQAFWQEPKSMRGDVVDKKQDEDVPIPVPVEDLTVEHYSVKLTTLSPESLGEITGEVKIEINQTDVTSSIHLSEVPQNLMIGQRSISHYSCAEIAEMYPPEFLVSTMVEYKEVNEVEHGSRESLMIDLNHADPSNGDTVNLQGKSYIVKAYVGRFNRPEPESAELIPIACGTIFAE